MTWQGVEGHDELVEQFQHSLDAGRLGSTYLFVGPEGIGKRMFAVRLAQSLLCQTTPPESLTACDACAACQQVIAGSHPDFDVVSRPPEKASLPLELFIGDKEHRNEEGLCHWISRKPALGRRKIAIVDDADYFNSQSANCLLKTLEEPPPNSVLILIGTSPQRQLPTIRSRSQILRFRPLPREVVARIVLNQGWVDTETEATRIAAMSGGSLAGARRWTDPDLWEFRESLLGALSQPPYLDLMKTVSEFVNAAGKEASLRRDRLRWVLDETTSYFRLVLRAIVGAPVEKETMIAPQVEFGSDPEALAACVDRCQIARQHVAANINQTTLIESWLDDLAQILLGRKQWASWD